MVDKYLLTGYEVTYCDSNLANQIKASLQWDFIATNCTSIDTPFLKQKKFQHFSQIDIMTKHQLTLTYMYGVSAEIVFDEIKLNAKLKMMMLFFSLYYNKSIFSNESAEKSSH